MTFCLEFLLIYASNFLEKQPRKFSWLKVKKGEGKAKRKSNFPNRPEN